MSDEPHEEQPQSHQDPINNDATITPATNDDALVVPEHLVDCNDALLDSMDGCVNYVEGVHSQYEEQQQSLIALPQELDYLNLCGTENDIPSGRKMSPKGANTIPNNPTSPHAEKNTSSCAVCLEEDVVFARLPCCDKATSTVQICTSCILLLSHPTSDGTSRVGKCPRCRSWLVIKAEVITTVSAAGTCRICHQIKDHLVEEDAICDACFLGRQCALLYECLNCHTTQRIPHPMYRYQSSPMQFGTVTWACHGLCGNFTHWRILPDQVRYIPVGDFPEVWHTDWVAVARARLERIDRQDRESCILL
ncbi:hypothetical protein FisN_3Hh381 [Fistulifera solaris]|uniref:RING-type domain-containing protein n=1 Tax=Fistulifera solaris TaxID=1519565 RepID=A0A1Z5JQT2_FISSO|nr:hypothetical protein FisN_3Hh381 [Fistulifera solaris]|eukprot:GAX16138.1 hypothetical protein FisN_3Hh381 [Fistulifera solaris]